MNGSDTEKEKTEFAVQDYKQVSAEGQMYETAADGGLIYNMLSKEALKNGTLNKYDKAARKTATLNLSGYTVNLSIPKNVTAYDMIPVDYSIDMDNKTQGSFTIEAVAYEEKGRYDGSCYDLTVPGTLDISYKYLGYVTATDDAENRNHATPTNDDVPAASYPDYKADEFNTSGTVLAGDLVWLKFEFTNSGNTVLDCEGQGNFNIYPKLYKKSANGGWDLAGGLFNDYVRELTYVYPGESRVFWCNFLADWSSPDFGKTAGNQGLLPGDYKIVFTALYRSELEYNPDVNMYHGRTMNVAEYEFKVADKPAETKANAVVTTTSYKSDKSKTSWLHYFEEFMTSFVQYRKGLMDKKTEGRLYLQVAPWTDQVVVKIIYNNPQKIISVKIPVSVESDSLSIEYNPDNINVIVNEEGYEEPVICIQSMPDLRANTHISPYPEYTILNDLLTMQECGCNVTSWQGFMWLFDDVLPYVTSNGQGSNRGINYCGDALRYALDCCRALGLKSLGLSSYPYGNTAVAKAATWASKKNFSFKPGSSASEADYSDPAVAKANSIVALYERSRWGDLYYSDRNGTNVYTIEDTRGLMRYEHNCRYAVGDESKKAFREWLIEKYGSLDGINKAWGTSYTDVNNIDPEANQPKDDMGGFGIWVRFENHDEPFYEWTLPLIDFDTFRTEVRLDSYELFIENVGKKDEGAQVQMRTEGSQFMAVGIDPLTTNMHYRQIMYAQLRGACIAELVANSDAVSAHCDYTRLVMTPSEIKELTKMAADSGITEMLLPQFHDMRDIALNDTYGNNYSVQYNLTENNIRGAYVQQLTSVYTWWKATYEGGGVPGILYQDYQCNGFATETQIKEMKFFKSKIDQMLADENVKAQTKTDRKQTVEGIEGKQSFESDFINEMIEKVKASR